MLCRINAKYSTKAELLNITFSLPVRILSELSLCNKAFDVRYCLPDFFLPCGLLANSVALTLKRVSESSGSLLKQPAETRESALLTSSQVVLAQNPTLRTAEQEPPPAPPRRRGDVERAVAFTLRLRFSSSEAAARRTPQRAAPACRSVCTDHSWDRAPC